MGVYLTVVAFEIRHKVKYDLYFSDQRICNVLGVINALSTPVSITDLLFVRVYRLLGVVFPYRHQHVKVVVSLLTITWVLWLIIVILPLIPFDPLKSAFAFGLVKECLLVRDGVVDFQYIVHLVQKLLASKRWVESFEICLILQTIMRFPKASVLQKAAAVLGLIDINAARWSFVGFYDVQYACANNFFVTGEERHLFNLFTISVVIYNFV